MTFDSLTFVVFLAIVFPVYALLRAWPARKNVLLVASCVFYGSWNPFFLILLAFTTVFDWWAAQRIHDAASETTRRRWFWASIVASLSLLGYFKYAQFLANTAIEWFALVGIAYRPIDLGIVLPLGISFYTFESISYIVDVYKRRITPTRNLRDYGLFMTFFPHLVAGPIMRFGDFNAQTTSPRTVTADGVALGGFLLAGGMFLKIVGADHIFAPVSDAVFAPAFKASASAAWMGASAFSLQLFCDFAGYSLAAIGVAKMFGFHLPSNFESPFAAIGIADLWRRWHISLSTWMRDYIYVPIVGNAGRGAAITYVAALITFLVSGLWHGAAWHFLVWGGLHGLFLVAERLLKRAVGAWAIWRTLAMRIVLALFTFVLFTIAVVFFRATTVGIGFDRLKSLFGWTPEGAEALPWNGDAKVFLVALVVALLVQGWLRNRKGWDWVPALPWPVRAALLSLMTLAIVLSPGKTQAFIYFQF